MRRQIVLPLSITIAVLLLLLVFRPIQLLMSVGLIVAILCLVTAVVSFERTLVVPLTNLLETLELRKQGDKSARIGLFARGKIGRILHILNELDYQQQAKQQHLERNLNRLNTVFTQMTDGVVILERDSKVKSANQAALTLFSATHTEAIQGSFAQLVRHHEIIDVLDHCISSQEPQQTVVDMRRNGLFLQIDVTPLISADVQGYVVLLHDLTTIRRMETVRRDFVSNVSHELRTPLASVRAVIETLQDGALDDRPMAERFLGRAAQEVDSMTQMVSELLELSKIESGKVPLRLESCELQPIINSAAERLQSHLERKSLRLEMQLRDDLPTVLIDAQRIEQVLTNLLHNATKFTPEGGRIRVGASRNNHELMVSVRDNGVGIPANDLSRVFERFYKADRSRHSGGTGLGLAITKHIIQAHGGDIWVTSKERKGSVFYFTLPVAEDVKAV